MSKIKVYSIQDRRYYEFVPKRRRLNDDEPAEPKEKVLSIENVDLEEEQDKKYHVEIHKIDFSQFCMRQYERVEGPFYTDIYYSGLYEKNDTLKNAYYICKNVIDFFYFTRYLNLRTGSELDEIDENTILINPEYPYDTVKYKNVIYTTFLSKRQVWDSVVCSTELSLTINVLDPNENDIRVLPEVDFMTLSNDFVYTPRLSVSVDDAFRIVLGHLMKKNSINITVSMYNFLKSKFLTLRNYYKVKIYSPLEQHRDVTTTSSGVILYGR